MWLLPSNQSPLPSPDPSSRQAPAFNSSHLACDNALRGSAAPRGVWPGRHSLSTVWTVPLARVHNCICGTVRGLALHPRHRPRAPENLQSLTAPEPAGAACAQTPQQEQADPPRSPCFPSCVPTCTHVSHRAGSPASLLISEALPPPHSEEGPRGKARGCRLTSRSCWTPPKIRITPSISCSRRRAQCCILRERTETSGGPVWCRHTLARAPRGAWRRPPSGNRSAPVTLSKRRPGGPGLLGRQGGDGL